MKNALIITAAFIWAMLPSVVLIGGPQNFHTIIAKKKAGGASYLISEDFEGTGYEEGAPPWVEDLLSLSTADEDSVTNVIIGSQNLEMVRSGGRCEVGVAFADTTVIDVYFGQVRRTNIGANNASFRFEDSSSTLIAELQFRNTGVLRTSYGSNSATTGTMAAGVNYQVWCSVDTSAGTATCEFQAIGAAKGAVAANVNAGSTGGTTGTDVGILNMTMSIDETIYVDKVRIDDETIGSSPE